MIEETKRAKPIWQQKETIKNQVLTSFGEIYYIEDGYTRLFADTIDRCLGVRSKLCGYQYSEFLVHEGECRLPSCHRNGKELLSVSVGEALGERCRRNFYSKQDEASAFCLRHRSGQMGKDRKKMDFESIYEEAQLVY